MSLQHRQHDAYRVLAFVACDGDSLEVIGFYCLCLTSFAIGKIDDPSDKEFGRVEAIPAVYLGMIAAHDDYIGSGVGKMLMAHALRTTVEIADMAGTYALTLDALNDELVEYYKKFDFQRFKQGETGLEMFLPLKSILAAILAADSDSNDRLEA